MKRKILIIGTLLILSITILSLIYPTTSATNNIKLSSDVIYSLGFFEITNTMLATNLTFLIILGLGLLIRKQINLKPSKIQLIFELIIEFFHEKMEIATLKNKKETYLFLPIILTVFLLFLIGNQFALLPLVNHLTVNGVPLFKTPSADFSLTIGATILIILLAHIMTIKNSPIKYFLNYSHLKEISTIRSIKEVPKAILEIFLAITDIIGEVAKFVSMSARLFGNVAAGELMVVVIGGLAIFTFYFVPIPFIFLGSFAGLIQAFVFGLLGVQYSSMLLNSVKEKTN